MEKLICIECPNGCELELNRNSDGSVQVRGNACKRGEAFAIGECIHPMRTLCTTVLTTLPSWPVLPVRTSGPIPKERMMDVMARIGKIVVRRQLRTGDVVLADVLGLGVDIIATSDTEEA